VPPCRTTTRSLKMIRTISPHPPPPPPGAFLLKPRVLPELLMEIVATRSFGRWFPLSRGRHNFPVFNKDVLWGLVNEGLFWCGGPLVVSPRTMGQVFFSGRVIFADDSFFNQFRYPFSDPFSRPSGCWIFFGRC